jgi:hypothetical protein
MLLRLLLAAVITSVALPALSTPQHRNGTDMWFNPAESGWGLNIFHQGDTLFACLFVYGPDGQPKWYVGSSLTGGRDGPYSGALYEATGPGFAAPFDPNAVVRRQVGTMTVDLGDDAGMVSYTVDGTSVVKQIVPFTFRRIPVAGIYRGFELQPATGSTPEIRKNQDFIIAESGDTVTIDVGSDSQPACTLAGARSQGGQVIVMTGTDRCGGRFGSWSMRIDPTPHGFAGSFIGDGIMSGLGRVAASLRAAPRMDGTGWRNDIWFPPNESGWGLNVVEQGDTIFATLFVYDAQDRSHWFVASNLTQSGSAYSGPLFEQTGPPFSGPFDRSKVTQRQVGTMTFDVRDANTAALTYTVDGVTVNKTVNRFAFRKNDVTGHYVGHLQGTVEDPGGTSDDPVEITIDDSATGFSMQTIGLAAPSCTYSAPPAQQFGEQRFVSGTFTCNSGRTGTFDMLDIYVTFDGFTSRILHHNTAAPQGAGITIGHMEGARREAN